MKTNILVSGLHYSGSSAVYDLLKEYENVGFVPGEFDEFRRPGMILDHLAGRINTSYPSRLTAYYKSKALKAHLYTFIRNVILLKRPQSIVKLPYRFIRDYKRYKPLKKLDIDLESSGYDSKLRHVKVWLNNLQNMFAKDKTHVVFDQPLLHAQNLDYWPQVLRPFKLILIYRDPRDQFTDLLNNHHLFLDYYSAPTGGIAEIYGGDRQGAFAYNIDAIKARLKAIDEIIYKLEEDEVLLVNFNHLAKDYDLQKKRIENFLGLKPEDHNQEFKFFNPEVSSKNVGIHKNKLNTDDLEQLSELIDWYEKRTKLDK